MFTGGRSPYGEHIFGFYGHHTQAATVLPAGTGDTFATAKNVYVVIDRPRSILELVYSPTDIRYTNGRTVRIDVGTMPHVYPTTVAQCLGLPTLMQGPDTVGHDSETKYACLKVQVPNLSDFYIVTIPRMEDASLATGLAAIAFGESDPYRGWERIKDVSYYLPYFELNLVHVTED